MQPTGEDRLDVRDAEKALADPKRIPYEEVRPEARPVFLRIVEIACVSLTASATHSVRLAPRARRRYSAAFKNSLSSTSALRRSDRSVPRATSP